MIIINDDGSIAVKCMDNMIKIMYLTKLHYNYVDFLDYEYVEKVKPNSQEQNDLVKKLHDANIPFVLRTDHEDYAIYHGRLIINDYQILPREREVFYNDHLTDYNLNLFNLMEKI